MSKGRIDYGSILQLLTLHPPAEGGMQVYAAGVSPWPRCDADASPARGYLYHPSRHSAGQPIVAGWAYQLIARLSFERGSWVGPVDARRVKPEEDATDVAREQIRQPEAPLFVFDAGRPGEVAA